MTAFIPTFKRDFANASHTLFSAGISTMMIGVKRGVKVWVAVIEGISVTVGGAGVDVNDSVRAGGEVVIDAGTVRLGRTDAEAGGSNAIVGVPVSILGVCGPDPQSR